MIDESLRGATIMDKDGYAYIVHPLTDGVPRCPPRLLAAWADWAAARPEAREATLLLAPEAMALPLAAVLGQRLGLPYVVVRKRAYGLPGEQAAYAETGYGGSVLHLNDVGPDDRVLVIDDVLSTGGTLRGVHAAINRTGATHVGTLVFMQKGPDVPGVVAMRRVQVTDGHVVLDEAP